MKPPSFRNNLSIGFLVGFCLGQVFLLAAIIFHEAEFIRMSPSLTYAFWIFLRSVATYGLLGGALGLALGAAFHAICRILGRGFAMVFPTILGLGVGATFLSYLVVWRQLEVFAGLPLDHPERLPAAALDALIALGGGLVMAIIVWRLRSGGKQHWELAHPRRWVGGVAVAILVLLFAAEHALRLENPGHNARWQPSQVVVVGLDALTFRVLGPMLREGELPSFRRLIDEGGWGTFLTYGAASSPMVWTTVATGKRVREHGINDFVAPARGSQGAEPLKSTDRRVKAVWNILSELGKTVAVVDWMITFPPEKVNGYVVTRLHMSEENRAYPPELNNELEEILSNVNDYGDPYRNENWNQLDHVFETARLLLEKQHIDALLLYEHVTDAVQHRYWKYYEPQKFDSTLWSADPQEAEVLDGFIEETYRHVDDLLGELMTRLDEDALLIVVSDHGQAAATRPQIYFAMDRLLAALGVLEFADEESREVDFTKSVAYRAVATPWVPTMGVNLNLKGREPNGIVDSEEAEPLISELVAKLRSIRFEDGQALLGPVYSVADGPSSSDEPDIAVTHSQFTRTHEFGTQQVVVEGRKYPLSHFLENSGMSGEHDRQGAIFLHGKGVKRGPIGQRVVSTPIQDLIRPLPDKIDAIDPLLPFLGRLGLMERANTLDVTPTILHALGLPVAEDMAGRILADIIDTGRAPEWRASYETGTREATRPTAAESDEEVMEQLKTLGYIN